MGFWTTAEAAIYALAETALTTANGGPVDLWWVGQNQPRDQVGPFATLKRMGPVSLGSVDEVQITPTGGTPPAGQELTYTNKPQKEFVITFQAFTPAVYGDSAATSLLDAVQTALNQQQATGALALAGLTVADKGTVQNLTGLLETKFEGRASLEVRFRASIPATQFGGYIATAKTTGTFNP